MPNTNKHTPLPWTVVKFDDESVPTIIGPSGDTRICELQSNETPAQIDANAAHIVRCVNERHELLAALKGLLAEVPLHKLNVRKDFSLLNAHAYANKVLHNAELVH